MKDEPSPDQTLVSFSVADVNYVVPRNYIVSMPNWSGGPQNGLVDIKVTFPGFLPLTEQTRQCLTEPRAYWPPGCIPVEFWIQAGGRLSDDDLFKNMTKQISPPALREGPSGFELYQWGAGGRRRDIYRKRTSRHTLIIDCSYYENSGKIGAVCSTESLLSNGGALFYRIDLDQIKNAEQIDQGIRALIESFTTNESEK
ncbi:hypothetical protein NLM33_46650 [Bradyrhizobium sp. CCGUVB1N3]|uniref:hypothetical protein n=1 Tax=Bradyrhizobium sp. CCGUVB1N3 TaxID=2949629 RepID=UPI0020B44CFC|nr:hypothetical protein [Bradyrhizobium sp. CCGUVB1N3]MCP3477639.1 hypothetical protein [Bradyrhizobium sp. CCGUVB1N3]